MLFNALQLDFCAALSDIKENCLSEPCALLCFAARRFASREVRRGASDFPRCETPIRQVTQGTLRGIFGHVRPKTLLKIGSEVAATPLSDDTGYDFYAEDLFCFFCTALFQNLMATVELKHSRF